MSFLHKGIQTLQELLFPARCLGCTEQLSSSRPPLLCPDCHYGALEIVPPFCTCCGTPLPLGDKVGDPGSGNHLCLSCLDNPLLLSKVRSSFVYQEPISTLVRQLKFNGNLNGLASIAALTKKNNAFCDLDEPDLILPVPLHVQRLRKRGFNQSLLLAKACFPHWHKKIRFDLIRRHRATIPQTRLDGKGRRNNLHKAFCVEHPFAVQEKRILLVDDVFTTGSTLHECTKVLLAAGAGEVEAFTVARSGGL
ncbi:MAG: ComF family protein [Candidatus Electrothrix sp. MAN1_4]|nr:ComF family protein [Candidatus Electrothrix sp. MAN1_4]